MYYFYDATYILVIIGAIISLIASMNVKSTFNRYDKYNSRSGLTGAMAAQEILRAAGITNVRIERDFFFELSCPIWVYEPFFYGTHQ